MGTDGTIALEGDFEHPMYGRSRLLMSASPTNEISVIAAAHQPAPTLVPGQTFDSFRSNRRLPAPVFTNTLGQSMFFSRLMPSRTDALWLHDPSAGGRTLFPLVVEDSAVTVHTDSGTEQRTIDFVQDFYVPGFEARACAENGRPSPFADDGSVVFLASGDVNGDGQEFILTARIEAVPCPADVNGDGQLNPNDFNAWILAFNTQSPACDQNGDGDCRQNDFNAWILNFNAGC